MQVDNLSWFPGHMTKTRRMITAAIKNMDAVCEILDARIPLSSRNPDVDELTAVSYTHLSLGIRRPPTASHHSRFQYVGILHHSRKIVNHSFARDSEFVQNPAAYLICSQNYGINSSIFYPRRLCHP